MKRLLAAVVLLLLSFAQIARADDASCYAAGMAVVNKAIADIHWPYVHLDSYVFGPDGGGGLHGATVYYHYGNSPPGWAGADTPTFQCAVGEDPNRYDAAGAACKAKPSFLSVFGGNTTDGLCDGGCGFVPDLTAGVTVTRNAFGQSLAATWKPTGATCDGSGGGATNTAPPPNSPGKFLPKVDALGKICGGGSCYDPNTDMYCGVSGGTQTCVPGTKARTSGGCITNGEQTLCVGTPPPMPAPPPGSPISNPAKEIKASDDYNVKQMTDSGSTNQTVTTNVYTSGSTPSSSGQQSGDSGPAAASSSGGPHGDGTTSFGGGDCNTPPVVNGSGGLNAIALQTWKTRCAVEGSKLGTGTVGTLGTLYTPSTDTTASVVSDFQTNIQQAPIGNAVTSFFAVGATGGSCPVWTLPASQWNPQMTFDYYCRPEASDILDMARVVLLIACAYVAWVIAMGDS